MAQHSALAKPTDTNPGAVFHWAVGIGEFFFPHSLPIPNSYPWSDDPRDFKYPLFSELGCDFPDGSYALYALYNEKASEFDKGLIDNWTEHVGNLMVLVRCDYTFFCEQRNVDWTFDRAVCSRLLLRHSFHSLIFHPCRALRMSQPSGLLSSTSYRPTRLILRSQPKMTSLLRYLRLQLCIYYGFVA
jgi:hypothetical protein